MVNRFPMLLNGERVWVEFIDTGAVRTARVDNADAMLFSTRHLVDFAETYLRSVLV